jgi:hypothetical protein
MPIEIKELHIKATVIDNKSGNAVTAEMSGHEKDKLKRELIQTCVQEVLQVLDDKKER